MKVFKTIIVFSFVLLCATSTLHPLIIANESCTSFTSEDCKTSGNSGGNSADESDNTPVRLEGLNYSPSMGQLIVESAGFFLSSQSYMASLLNQVEWSEIKGTNYFRMQNTLYYAISNMLNANDRYYYLHRLSEVTPYNEAVVDMLVKFDYDGFMKEKDLNPSIFNEVKALLSRGDVRGVYKQMYKKSVKILNRLEKIRERLDWETLPEISAFWRLNQEYAQFGLYGQYVAEVFFRVNGMQ